MALEARVGNTLDGCTYRFLSLVAAPVYGGDRDFEVYDLVIQWVNDGGLMNKYGDGALQGAISFKSKWFITITVWSTLCIGCSLVVLVNVVTFLNINNCESWVIPKCIC